jgi:ribonuclease D
VTDRNSEYLYITEQHQLDAYCQQASQAKVLALDTEFVRTRTLYSELGLIQVNDGVSIALVDPLCELDLEPFWSLLTDQTIVKVLHSCHEDLEVFKLYANRLPIPLLDTQIAGQFLFQGRVLGFGAMVEQELGIELDKGEARTNWLKRPLSENQIHYAVNDVKYLMPLYHALVEQLEQKGWLEYCLAESNHKVCLKAEDKNENLLYLDFGNAWQLRPRSLAILQELSVWRLEQAKKRNLALGFVAKDSTLFAVAQRRPGDLNSLRNIPGINPNEIKYHGRAMLNCVERGKQLPQEQCPEKVPRLTDYKSYKQAYKSLKQWVSEAIEASGLPIEVIATKKQMNQWIKWVWQVSHAECPDFEHSWRKELIAPAMEKWREKYQHSTEQ